MQLLSLGTTLSGFCSKSLQLNCCKFWSVPCNTRPRDIPSASSSTPEMQVVCKLYASKRRQVKNCDLDSTLRSDWNYGIII